MLLGLIVLLYSSGPYDRTKATQLGRCGRQPTCFAFERSDDMSLVAKKSLSDVLITTRLESSDVAIDRYHLSNPVGFARPNARPSRHHCWSAART